MQGDVAGMDVGINGVPGKAKGLSASGAKKAVNGKGYILAYEVESSKTLTVDGTAYNVGGKTCFCWPYAIFTSGGDSHKIWVDNGESIIIYSYETLMYARDLLSVGSGGSYAYYYSFAPIRFNKGFSLTDGRVIYTLDPI